MAMAIQILSLVISHKYPINSIVLQQLRLLVEKTVQGIMLAKLELCTWFSDTSGKFVLTTNA
ncbi:uncharacterized protein PHALS_15038 [Plasmopara halstedii]|uniref:Uncharacterized protein n=1 Tax=Plasmopara halstedii TaxID=4781 RepID=A0A0P1A948_PLAHL|nr:uncharacterized protein PHALS_15038 [Plasmopara halstedii]CEG37221.1 hypothetical protein PHALS_15038 [Plasmopara halstedii]|eukprot:XP_024573590.1 hypothetical protein PHALS_15038 [Plasmopara halstedii]